MINTSHAVKDGLSQRPLASLLCAYAGRDAPRHRLLWTFDARLAEIVRTTFQPVIGQMRIAWWDEVLDDAGDAKGRGDPLVDALRAAGLAESPGLRGMLDGWEALLEEVLDEGVLRRFADGRGGGLFRALGGDGEAPEWLVASGRLWALWDLAGHLQAEDPARVRAIDLARGELPAVAQAEWPRRWKPLRIATGLARHDVIRAVVPCAGLTPRLYARLLRLAVLGG